MKHVKMFESFINEANELVKAQSDCKAAMFQLQKDVDKLFQDIVKAGYLKSFTTKITPWNDGYELSIRSKDNWKEDYAKETPFILDWTYNNTNLYLQPATFFENALEKGEATYLEAELLKFREDKSLVASKRYAINSKADIPKAAKEYIKDVRDQIEIVRKKGEL